MSIRVLTLSTQSDMMADKLDKYFLEKGVLLMAEVRGLGGWLAERCQQESLSLRQAAMKIGISHATIADIIKGGRPSPETIKRLAEAFSGSGDHEKIALQDELLVLAGYRSERPEVQLSQPLAQLIDIMSEFSRPQLKIMARFAEFLAEIPVKGGRKG